MIKLKELILELTKRQRELKKDYLFQQSSLKSSNKIPTFDVVWNDVKSSDGYSHYAESLSNVDSNYTEEEIDDIIKKVQEMYDDVIYEYDNLDGEFCWRMLTLPIGLDPKMLPQLGIYWAITDVAAEAHWGKFTSNYTKVTYKATIDKDIIDWSGTIFSRMDLDLGEEEQEIRFIKNSKIFVHNVFYNGNYHNINDYRIT